MKAPVVRSIAGPAGRLEVLLERPHAATGAAPRAAVVFAHPHPLHGGTMHTKGVYRATKALASIGCAVLRFNFRGVGHSEGSFDNGVGELDDMRAGLDFMTAQFPGAELWTAGFSFGAYVALTVGALDDRAARLIGIAPALHMYDFSAVRQSRKPKYFVQGELDELCPLPNLRAFFDELPPPKQLAIVPGANHLFKDKMPELGAALIDVLDNRNDGR
jgi:alpha/beta superfamily hydrolase